MKKLELIKATAALVVSTGVGAIFGNLIKVTTPKDTKLLMRICIGAGTIVLTGIASSMSAVYVEKQFDEVSCWIKKTVTAEEKIETEETPV